MNIPIGILPEGTVIEVLYPYYDIEGAKLRPAVIIDKDDERATVILLKITGAKRNGDYDIPLKKPEIAGLKPNSKVRVDHILTVPITNNYKVLGHFDELDYIATKIMYEQVVGSVHIEKIDIENNKSKK